MPHRWLGRSPYTLAMLLCLITGTNGWAGPSQPAGQQNSTAPPGMSEAAMSHMSGHMYMTALRSPKPGDQKKADAVVEAAKAALAPYQDYRNAIADGYQIFLPNVPQSQYHFTKYEYGLKARSHFDPLKPTSLLYAKTPDGYKLVGAMYTDWVEATEEEIDDRIPLSVARWHQHINFCKAPGSQKAAYFGPDAKFGFPVSNE